MSISGLVPQLRTTDLEASIDFYVSKLGFELDFRYSDFYAGIKVAEQSFHLKLVDDKDPSIEFVATGDHFHLFFRTDDADVEAERMKCSDVEFLKEIDSTPWGTREFYVRDNQGYVLCIAEG